MTKSERFTELNKTEYGADYNNLIFLNANEILAATEKRAKILDFLTTKVQTDFNGTKFDTAQLSAGCRLCGEGFWSCLFISGKCNAACFYCPTSQDAEGVPITNSIEFPTPEMYAAYVKKMGFKGVALSGGEPLLNFEKSIAYIKAVRELLGSELYIWIYTNGILATVEKMQQLHKAGVNEIRFDIGATNYSTEKVKLAVGIISVVTVEIPAISEHILKIKTAVEELKAMGANHINLHQLRLTPHNYAKLAARKYTYSHGLKVTVLDSELAALEVLRWNFAEQINFPINYCSFQFKNQFQTLAGRMRSAKYIINSYEALTQTGLIRTLSAIGTVAQMLSLRENFKLAKIDTDLYFFVSKEKLFFHPTVSKFVSLFSLIVSVQYHSSSTKQGVNYHYPFVDVLINKRKIFVEKATVTQLIVLEAENVLKFMDLIRFGFLAKIENAAQNTKLQQSFANIQDLARFEVLEYGVQEIM